MAKASIIPGNNNEIKEKTNETLFDLIHSNYQAGNEFLREQYRDTLFKEIISNSSKDKPALAKIFMDIAGSHIKLAEAEEAVQELKLQYYNDAATTCQYVLKLAEGDVLKTSVYDTLNSIQSSIINLCSSNLSPLREIKGQEDIDILCHKKQLQVLREQTKKKLQVIESYKERNEKEAYVNESALLFKEIARGMEQYLAELFQEAENVIGPAPCEYAVVGLGSMALRQMTPYSDLEFAIITENDDYRQSSESKVKDYFKNLSHLVHFMVINLGETIIPTSRFSLDLSEFILQAVNFDLGGKTPIGRIEQDKPYELIQTVKGMMYYLKNEDSKTEHRDKHLAGVLQKVCFVYGQPELTQIYQIEAQSFLEKINETGKTNYESRAFKALWEGVEERDYTKKTPSSTSVDGNLKQFSFNPYESMGRLFDVKQEIYRLPDRLIYNLGLIYGIQEESSWNTIDKLCELGKISSVGAFNLKKALTFATNLRLNTYAHYGYQKETMDFSKTYSQSQNEAEELIEAISTTFNLTRKDLEPGGKLFEYYKAILPLHEKLVEFCTEKSVENKDSFFSNEEFYSNTPKIIASIHTRLLQYKEALDPQLQELEDLKARLGHEHPDVATCLNNVGFTYEALGNYTEAQKYLLEALGLRQKVLRPEHLDVATSLNNVGMSYGGLGQHQEALKYLQEALELYKRVLGPEHPDVATCLNNVGSTYGKLGQHHEALQYLREALELWQKVLKTEHPDVAACLNNVGCTYEALGNYTEAQKYLLEALELMKKVLGSEHPNVANNLNCVGNIYRALGNYIEALKYQREALELREKILEHEHPCVAQSLSNIGITYGKLGQHQEALKYQRKALKLFKKLLEPEHSDVATCLNNVGGAYGALGHNQEALKHQLEALELRKKILEHEHPDVAQSLNNVGGAYGALGNHQEALKYQLEALELFQKKLGHEHPAVATCLYNVGYTYEELGQHQEALKYQLEALELLQKKLEPDPLNIAQSLNNVGMSYGALGQPHEALQYLLEALEICLGHEHPAVATCLYNVGSNYGKLGNHQEALKYQLEALELLQKKLGYEHPNVARSLNSVGSTYEELGQHQEALKYQLEALELLQKLLEPDPLNIAQSLNNVGMSYGALGQPHEALQYLLEALEICQEILVPDHPYVTLTLNNVTRTYNEIDRETEIEQSTSLGDSSVSEFVDSNL